MFTFGSVSTTLGLALLLEEQEEGDIVVEGVVHVGDILVLFWLASGISNLDAVEEKDRVAVAGKGGSRDVLEPGTKTCSGPLHASFIVMMSL